MSESGGAQGCIHCSVCHARFPDEGDNVWRPDRCRRERRSLRGTLREVRNEEWTSTSDN
jgi:hypothetical protein